MSLKYKHTTYTLSEWTTLNPVIVDNEIIIVSDLNKIKRGDGTSTFTELSYLSSEVFNVKDFGAVGDFDGNTGTDDTIAIQAAIDAAVLQKKTCYFPAGNYFITQTLIINDCVELRGENELTTTISSYVENIYLLKVLVDHSIENLKVSNLRFDAYNEGNGIEIDVTDPYSLHAAEFKNIIIVRVKTGFKQFSDTGNQLIYMCLFTNVHIQQQISVVGWDISGGCYNLFSNCSATNANNANDYTGWTVVQIGSTFVNIGTDTHSYFNNPGGSIDGYYVECTPAHNAYRPQYSLGVLRLFDINSISNIVFVNVDKDRYENFIYLQEYSKHITIKNVSVLQTIGEPPLYPIYFEANTAGGLVSGFNYNLLFAYKLEVYTTADKLEKYIFVDCADITATNRINKVVTALPTASDKFRYSQLILKGGTGVADAVYVCLKNSSDAYEWLLIG